ncbi:MAG TPA: serine/threonine-protein kinase [Gemmatimonadales bacterium]|nr:serine/threonine-protein kinase [Gemmatimonadales bacterium]
MSGDTAEGMHPIQRDPELESKLAEEVKGEFAVERLLGRGGMAVVFLARDLQLDRKVAIKVLPPELTYGQGLIERFKREARTAATLDHPNIVPIYRIAKSGKLFWFAMKYIVGESLAELLEREKTIPPDRAAAILTQVADALESAHQHGIIHRDVKPANVMLDQRDWVTVTDFGIAKAVGLQSLTSSEALIGTPYYMSPEQCSGKQPLTGASDQYALGVMTYQMLSGELPFTGFTTVEIVKQHCFDPPPPLDVLRPGLPRSLVKAVERALAKKPEERFPSVTEFATALAAAAHGSGVVAPPPGRKGALPRARPASAPRRRWWAILLSALGGLTAVGLIGVVIWQWRGNQSGAGQPPPGTDRQPDSAVTTRTVHADSAAAAAPPVVQPTKPSSVASAPPETSRTVTPAPQPARPAPRDARLFLRGVSGGATITVDGRQVRDSIVLLRSPGGHLITVTRPGFEPWTDMLWADAGDQLARWVTATPLWVDADSAAAPTEPSSARPAPRDARLFLRGVSGSATITVDGRQVSDSIVLLRPPGRHVITVTRAGFEPWTDTLWADAGDQMARWVTATPVARP